MLIEKYWYLLMAVAAISHAVWNFLLKQSEDKSIFLWSLRLWAVIIFLPVAIVLWPDIGIPLKDIAFWGIGSIVLHSIYAKLLAKAYEYNDFSLAYPVARGIGPLITVFVGIIFLGERASYWTLTGAAGIFAGMYISYSGWSFKYGIRTLQVLMNNPLPVLVGLSIAGYTVFDKLALSFIPAVALNVIESAGQVLFLGIDVWKKDKAVISQAWRRSWYKMAAAGFLSALSYILALVVLTKIPVSKVAPIRESSIVIGTVLGILFLQEKLTIEKMVGSILIFLGVIMIILR